MRVLLKEPDTILESSSFGRNTWSENCGDALRGPKVINVSPPKITLGVLRGNKGRHREVGAKQGMLVSRSRQRLGVLPVLGERGTW